MTTPTSTPAKTPTGIKAQAEMLREALRLECLRTNRLEAHAERLAAALESMDKWESDGRPVPIHVQMQVVRAALAAWKSK